MPTKTETVLSTLNAALDGIATANVRRNPTMPSGFEAGPLIAMFDGTPELTGETLGNTGSREYEHTVQLEIAVTGSTEAARRDLVSDLCIAIGNILDADRTLSGVVSYLIFSPLGDPVSDLFSGADDVSGGSIDVTIFYETNTNPMEVV